MSLASWVKQITTGNDTGGASEDRWVGCVDGVEGAAVMGWAYDRLNPAAAMTVEAVTDAGESCATTADLPRDDLKAAGHGTGRYGFKLDLTPLALKDETVIVRFAESRYPISKTPISLEAPRIESGDAVDQTVVGRWIGSIDRVRRGAIEGWAYDRLYPTCSVAVEAVASSGRSCFTIANLRRDDVKAAGHGTGLYGFVLDLTPLALKDETVIVRFAESRHPISETPIEFDAQRAILSNEMPSAYADVMLLMATMVYQAAAERGLADQPRGER